MKFWTLVLKGRCSECGEKVQTKDQANGRLWFCPNGHSRLQSNESEPFR